MFQCLNSGTCANFCSCLIREKHLKNYRKAIKDVKGLIHNKNFIFGQENHGHSFLKFYDNSTKKLINIPVQEDLRNYSGVTMIDKNKLFICGGVNYQMNNVVSHSKLYSISEERFTQLPNMHDIRFNFSILHFKNKIYVTGGRGYGANDVAIISKCEYFNLETKTWHRMADMKIKRCGHQMFAYNNKIYALGGLSVDKKVRFMEEYNPFTDCWRITTKSLVFDLYNFEIFSHELDEVMIIGGLHHKGYSNFIHSFNMKTSRIKCVGILKNHRSNFKLFYDRRKMKLLLMGGAVSAGNQPLQNYLEVFDLINQRSTVCNVDNSVNLASITKFNYNKISVIIQNSLKSKKLKPKELR